MARARTKPPKDLLDYVAMRLAQWRSNEAAAREHFTSVFGDQPLSKAEISAMRTGREVIYHQIVRLEHIRDEDEALAYVEEDLADIRRRLADFEQRPPSLVRSLESPEREETMGRIRNEFLDRIAVAETILSGVNRDAVAPLARARRAAQRIEEHRQAMADAAEERARAIEAALDAGMTQAEVARQLGLTPSAVKKILQRGWPKQEPSRPIDAAGDA